MFTSIIATFLLTVPLAQCAPLSQSRPLAPLYRRAESISTRYIVSLRDDTVDPANRVAWLNRILAPATPMVSAKSIDDNENGVIHQWDAAVFNGVAGHFDEDSLNILRAQSEVAWIEEDAVLHKSVSSLTQQSNAPWGLSRLSSPVPLNVPARRFDPTNTTFSYTFPSTAGKGVDIYILDSGIRTTHQDFEGRAEFLETFVNGAPDTDRDGHGTHVACTTSGSFFGVAKAANVFAVKVLNDQGAGPVSAIISGLNLVSQRFANQTSSTITTPNGNNSTVVVPQSGGAAAPANIVRPPTLRARAIANANNFTLLNQLPTSLNSTTGSQGGRRPAVVNMSLGGSSNSRSLDRAVRALISQGIVVVVAAGNDGVDVGNSSPAGVQEAITVGAMDVRDQVPSFSNFGEQVTVFAPGDDILACGISSDTASAVLSGTSMASPHVAGLSALLLGEEPTLTPAQV
ncbi:subtilisin-like serine protease [Serendipita sp. 399]|nr:subtilisin-like serine protease [Serendipita sp. 399]